MADLYPGTKKPISLYKDRRFHGDQREREMQLRRSTTLYVGNLSFYTNEEQVFELFSKAGEIKRIIMGLDRKKKTPCGFCFVEYFTRAAADNSVHFISGSKLDERVIRVDYDAGFEPGRQFGRGRSGGQVRDEYRTDYDPGRGGYGKATGGQTGMSGMQLWGENESVPNGGRFNGPRRGRGRGRRGRSYGGRGGGRYGGGRYDYDGPRGRAPKRYRDYEDDGRYERARDDDDGGGGYRDTKTRRMDEGESERGFGGSEGRDGEGAQDDRADDEEQTHNARFERGRQNEFEEEM